MDLTLDDAGGDAKPEVRLPPPRTSEPQGTARNASQNEGFVYDLTSGIGERRRRRDVEGEIMGGSLSSSQLLQSHSQRSRNTRSVSQRDEMSVSATPRKIATPRKSVTPREQHPRTESSMTPSRRSRRTTIEDSEVMMQIDNVEMETEMEEPGPRVPYFEPLPDFTPQPASKKQFKKFSDWKMPDVPLDYAQIRKLWEKYINEFKDDHARFVADRMERARVANQKAERAWLEKQRKLDEETAARQTDTKWWDAPAISAPAVGKASENTFTFTMRPCVKGAQATKLHVEMTPMYSTSTDVPHYRTHYPIKRSQLMQSDRDLLFWPEATERDDLSEDEIKEKLKGQFHFRMLASRGAQTCYTQIGKQWQPYCEAFLEELNLSEEDMLRFLIDASCDEEIIKTEFKKILHDRKEVAPTKLLKDTRAELNRAPQASAGSIVKLLSKFWEDEKALALKELKFKYLALAFYAIGSCYRVEANMPCFNVIYCLLHSPHLDMAEFLDPESRDAKKELEYSAATHFDLACRICHVYPCFVHGIESLWDYRPPDPPESQDDDEHDLEDKLYPFFDTLTTLHRRSMGRKPVRAPLPMEDRQARDMEFEDEALYGEPNKQGKATVFFPCNHAGPCEEGICHCAHRFCEKSCGCDASCKNRFKGCKCARRGKVCSEESRCPCLKWDRECDPDLCGTCGVYEVLDPQNRDKDTEADASWFKERCQNCQIQRKVPKRTLIGQSTVHGIGLFAGEDIKRGEYIGEYLGAKLNWKQAERSGLYLLLNGYSYLFDMTGDQTVDSMVLGNKMRFINSIKDRWNCTPRVLMCNTEQRMALFASRDITAGEELSFDYGDHFFYNHEDSVVKRKEKGRSGAAMAAAAKAADVKGRYSRKPYGKRGPYKSNSKKKEKEKEKGAAAAVAVKEGKQATKTMRKSVVKEVRGAKVSALSVRAMVDALREEAGAGAGADKDEDDEDDMDIDGDGDVEMDTDNDSVDDSLDEDFDGAESEAEVAESSDGEDGEAESGAGSGRNVRRRRGGNR